MATFRGTLEVEGDPASNIITDVDVSEGRISMWGGDSEIGSWDLNDITIEESEGAFRIIAEDESLVLRLRDAKRFAGAVGVDIAPTLSADMAGPIIPTPNQRATPDTPRVVDEPIDLVIADPVSEGSLEPTRPGPDESPLARPLSWSLVGAAGLLFVGALLDWGAFRLTNSSFPFARFLVVLAGFAALAAAYLGLALEKRRDVALVGFLGGLIAVIVILMYARRAGIGWGFIVTILGTVALISISAFALSHLGAPPPDTDQ
jgi:hypothetical protein